MEWIKFSDKLPHDKQIIFVRNPVLGKNLKRTFGLKFYNSTNRVNFTSFVCQYWKPLEKGLIHIDLPMTNIFNLSELDRFAIEQEYECNIIGAIYVNGDTTLILKQKD